MTNSVAMPATLKSVKVLNAKRPNQVVDELAGAALAAHFKPLGGTIGPTAVLGPSQTGVIWLDVSARERRQLPRRLLHRIHLTYPEAPVPGIIPADVIETVAKVRLARRPAAVIAPPLSGPGWVDVNGCCSTVTSHREAVSSVRNSLYFPERFAIDFVQINEEDRFYTGDPKDLNSWGYFGEPVHAVSNGTIVEAVDGLPEQTPLQPPTGITAHTIAGNHVIEKFEQDGYTYYVLYAHLKTGSLTAAGIHEGQRVKAGQKLGRVGNSGASGAPHLHFQIMDEPDVVAADGLPYEFNSFDLQGRVASQKALDDTFDNGVPLKFDPHAPTGQRRVQIPLNLEIVGFTSCRFHPHPHHGHQSMNDPPCRDSER
ncbi:M23 family metallopeptidase [Streptomyces sp. NBC_01619]|uniref:M23 family metallopeptidase n=1 Tax=Streptomyces sp. NBC_01619 TaxID=2975901 RepID=UPI002258D7BA|nr:M23 family metallopeptidase [Streptomyces sp. NBC_01619]MCX4515784.1 M23 family metallopeptidase [Streptomyces sp. NBC_01619]